MVPDRIKLDGLEEKWVAAWEAAQTFRFDRSRTRDEIFAIDTPPPTVSGSLHAGSAYSYTHTDIIARFWRMRGRALFYPMGWDDNGLPTERRVQNYYGVRCDPSLPYDPAFEPPASPGAHQVPVSRRNFIELCERLTAIDEQAFEAVWRRIGLSVDWSLTYQTIGTPARRTSQLAFLRNLARGEAYLAEAPTLWDVTFQTAVAQAELEDREMPGAFYQLAFQGPNGPVWVESTRPELIPACVALVVNPGDGRYSGLVGATVRTPIFDVEVPVVAHRLADPAKGTGIAMICTFGDVTDVTWWRELQLPTRPVIGWDGRFIPDPPSGIHSQAGRHAYAELAGLTVREAQDRILAMLRQDSALGGEPRPIMHAVKFFEKGDRPLEIVTTRQWYLRNGGIDQALRNALIARGRELIWHPQHMRVRYENWVEGLAGDWLVSRQRYFGVPIPLWYPLNADAAPDYDRPIVPAEGSLPVDPSIDAPPGYIEDQRGKPNGFIGDPDVMDTWATSSLTPQIGGRWVDDPDLFGRVFPMDLRPQAHDIIRTWLFATIVRAHLEHGTLPWKHAAISGWILDPDRKKMSKSRGNVVTPMSLLEKYGSDGFRYWAASGRLGVDAAFDDGQLKIGRRLAIKVLNVSRFVLGLGTVAPPEAVRDQPIDRSVIGQPIDRSMIASLAAVVDEATKAYEAYEHTRALERTESFFWTFCDDYVELVKTRAYGEFGEEAAASARSALATALSTLLRLFAPVLPFVTEEVWSWWQNGSVHHASWPSIDELRLPGPPGDSAVLRAASSVISAVRKAKSDAKLSMRAPVLSVVVQGPVDALESVRQSMTDLKAAGHAREFEFIPDATASSLTTTVHLSG